MSILITALLITAISVTGSFSVAFLYINSKTHCLKRPTIKEYPQVMIAKYNPKQNEKDKKRTEVKTK